MNQSYKACDGEHSEPLEYYTTAPLLLYVFLKYIIKGHSLKK